ncbi:hypothetical protein E2C01_075708 [Portunus trituberculatus]|uniref:Uncharacterized protein n=1 Tax=Portunus trituberculatus TaxID=210409 RepID=A0A5B7IHS4_PORTR|nr:hypothetical protein [Portunus trituberculatus]
MQVRGRQGTASPPQGRAALQREGRSHTQASDDTTTFLRNLGRGAVLNRPGKRKRKIEEEKTSEHKPGTPHFKERMINWRNWLLKFPDETKVDVLRPNDRWRSLQVHRAAQLAGGTLAVQQPPPWSRPKTH